jgi:hypothetical protein
MKSRAAAALLCASLVPMLGVGHCPPGDVRAFAEEACIRIVGPGSRPSTKVVSLDTWSSGPGGPLVRSRLEVTACSTTYSVAIDGTIKEFGPGRLEPGDAKALHDALVEAGGLDADSAPFSPVCPIGSHSYRSEVVVYEPSPLPGTAWSNAFDFGTCSSSPQTSAIESLLSAWIAAHFDLSQPLPDTISLPGGSTVMPPQIHLITPFD